MLKRPRGDNCWHITKKKHRTTVLTFYTQMPTPTAAGQKKGFLHLRLNASTSRNSQEMCERWILPGGDAQRLSVCLSSPVAIFTCQRSPEEWAMALTCVVSGGRAETQSGRDQGSNLCRNWYKMERSTSLMAADVSSLTRSDQEVQIVWHDCGTFLDFFLFQ